MLQAGRPIFKESGGVLLSPENTKRVILGKTGRYSPKKDYANK